MSGLTLYQLADDYRTLMDLAADPEADDASFSAALDAIQDDFKAKGVAVAQVARNLESAAAQMDEAIKTMRRRMEAVGKRADQIRGYLKSQMEAVGITKIESPYFAISIRKNPPKLWVDTDALIPGDLLRHIPERWEPDKPLIAAAIKDGQSIDGCRLEQSTRLEIK